MLENQFIQFSKSIDPLKKEVALPARPNEEICFQVYDMTQDTSIVLVTPDCSTEIGTVELGTKTIGDYFQCAIKYSNLAPKEMFRIKVLLGSNVAHYSNLLINDPDAELSQVKYLCKENAFGLVFGKNDDDGEYFYLQQAIPINLHSPQYGQEDKIYTKLSGEQVTLYSQVTKEYNGETDYIPMEWHEKILLALTCDEVYINGERVTKSDNYEIDHENCTYTDCGIKLMRATFKVKANVTQRNSNY